jgi:hypothetical protein
VDILDIQLTSGNISESDNLTSSIIGDLDDTSRLVGLEIMDASTILACHFCDTLDEVDSRK